ncbi:MAG: 4'-phosphopantetheinyl transferase superfamily protein [Treponema sp.]|jgi:phosphopantetheinyl transferase|nr:4'-phosphopantetheinyl transferase superfamily protein [Treponema sp.]
MSYYLGLSVLSNNNNGQQNKNRQKLLSAEARRILSEFAGRTITDDDMVKETQGRPFFPGREADFNITHSGALAAVSFVRGKNLRTGCDLELVRKRSKAPAIAADSFSVSERDYVFFQGCFDEKRFFQIWTLKECYIKLRGLSVFDMVKVPSFIHGESFAFNAGLVSPLAFYLYELSAADERYILATAIEGTEETPEIRWFSQARMSCECMAKITGK